MNEKTKEATKRLVALLDSIDVERETRMNKLAVMISRVRALNRQHGDTPFRYIADEHLIDADDVVEGLASDSNKVNAIKTLAGELSAAIRAEYETSTPYQRHGLADPQVREQVWNLTGGVCAYCGANLARDSSTEGETFNVEHVVPRSAGGPDNIANYVPACSGCNASKSDKHVLMFIRQNLPGRISKPELKIVGGDE